MNVPARRPQNLTSNAFKVIGNDPKGKIVWKAGRLDNKTILSITDNGPGLNEDQINNFYQDVQNKNARTGFGFHLIRDLSKAIKYHISIESTPGSGTTIILNEGWLRDLRSQL